MSEVMPGSPVIEIRAVPSLGDFRRALRAIQRRRKPDKVAGAVATGAAWGGAVMAYTLQSPWWYAAAVAVGGGCYVVRGRRSAAPLRRWLLGSGRAAVRLGEWRVRVDEGGVSWRTASTEGAAEWDAYTHYLETAQQFIVLHRKLSGTAPLIIFPKHELATGEADQIRAYLDQHLTFLPERRRTARL
ncbi:YcxB family protein [Streptomyces sp. NPDC051940]|uniref:YcxB family protein n=1 Tax=Streptomyces sp. NPDC051940 TaxID=3155675 RepID=UPI00342E7692